MTSDKGPLWPLVFISLIVFVQSSKIFFMIPLTTISEKNIYVPLIDALAKRGHEVTVASIKKSSYDSKNITEFTTIDTKDFLGALSDPKANRQLGKRFMYSYTHEWNSEACHKVFQNSKFQSAIQEKYDLIFTNYWFQHCFAGILYQQQSPFIMMSTMPPLPYVFELTGYKVPMSIVPNPLMMTTSDMNFMDRVENLVFDLYWTIFTKWSYIPASEQVYRKYLGQDLPGGHDIEKNVSLIFSNSHFTLNAPSPVLPDIIEIGGIHCKPGNPLPKDIQEFVEGAKDGFIYFSMGTIVKAKLMPKEWIDIFIDVFSKLKQRVVFKWEDDETIPKFSKNVKTWKWLPQQDILAHKNIRLFISHGGGLSTQESLYHGVPVIGLPIMVDQDLNMRNAENKGYAKMLEILDLSEESLMSTINEILKPKYAERAKELSVLHRDQQETPLQRAVFYTEYVIRHKGTKHMRSPGRNLTWFQYYMMDVIAFIILSFLIFILTIIYTIKFIYNIIFGKRNDKSNSKKKRQ